jgi:predicted DNA-binding antitoxin AbrB/MazE fold protein
MRSKTVRHNNKKRDAMAGTIRARVKGGMLEPLDTLNLPEGKEVAVMILDVPSARNVDAFRRELMNRAAGGRLSASRHWRWGPSHRSCWLQT